MRNVVRMDLPDPGPAYFKDKTKLIKRKRKSVTKGNEAHRLWKQARGTLAMIAAIDTLSAMNSGLPWCMYCEADTATALKKARRLAIIDHWEPIKEAPERAFDWENHFLACQRCNGFFKLADFPRDPATRKPLLIHLVDDPMDLHLEYEPTNGTLIPRSPKGTKTLQFFQLRDFDGSRYGVWSAIIEHLRKYDAAVRAGDAAKVAMLRDYIVHSRHRSVVQLLVTIALGPHGGALTAPDMPALVTAHGVDTWL